MAVLSTYTNDNVAEPADRYVTVNSDGSTRLTPLDVLRTGILSDSSVGSGSIANNAVTAGKLATSSVTLSKVDNTSFRNGTDANGWIITTTVWGKKVYTKKVTQAITLPAGISFADYTLTSTPVDVGANIANYNFNFTAILPTGNRQVSTSFMFTASSISLGAINHFTGGGTTPTAYITLQISEV